MAAGGEEDKGTEEEELEACNGTAFWCGGGGGRETAEEACCRVRSGRDTDSDPSGDGDRCWTEDEATEPPASPVDELVDEEKESDERRGRGPEGIYRCLPLVLPPPLPWALVYVSRSSAAVPLRERLCPGLPSCCRCGGVMAFLWLGVS